MIKCLVNIDRNSKRRQWGNKGKIWRRQTMITQEIINRMRITSISSTFPDGNRSIWIRVMWRSGGWRIHGLRICWRRMGIMRRRLRHCRTNWPCPALICNKRWRSNFNWTWWKRWNSTNILVGVTQWTRRWNWKDLLERRRIVHGGREERCVLKESYISRHRVSSCSWRVTLVTLLKTRIT